MTRDDVGPADDGLITPEVGSWTLTKHRLVKLYIDLFATGMRLKWQRRVYVELYAGAGFSRIRNKGKLIYGSPILALITRDRFNEYIFCESDQEKLAALKQRVNRIAPEAKVEYVPGDCNQVVDDICSRMLPFSREHKVLSLCFVDPYDIGIKFATILKLAERFVDFLVLLALHMDANRNYSNYVSAKSSKVDEFLGSADWRSRWNEVQMQPMSFPRFLAHEYAERMTSLGYLENPLYKMKEVRSDEKNLPLYHLALFSRHETAYDYWDEVLKYSTDQRSLF